MEPIAILNAAEGATIDDVFYGRPENIGDRRSVATDCGFWRDQGICAKS